MLRFVADKPGSLASGTLYAAKLANQAPDPADGKPSWGVTWIKLGNGGRAV